MGSYAQINGQSITSDKPGAISIIGGVVVFGDGSSYNPATGALINRGPGSVYVNGRLLGSGPQDVPAPQDAAAATSGERVFDRFPTTSLALTVRDASFSVEPHSGSGMLVKLTGPKEEIDAFEVEAVGGQLSITERPPKGAGTIRGSVVVGLRMQAGGDIVISNVSVGVSAVRVSVQVPVGTPIGTTIVGSGDITIGDVRGLLDVAIKGSGDVWAKSAREVLALHIQGSGDVTVDDAQVDRLSVSVQGSGDVDIRGGSARNAKLVVQGSGDVEFDGTASSAHLECYGSGDIRVYRCLTPPVEVRRGSGRIKVLQVG